MTPDDVLKFYGGPAVVGRVAGCSPSLIYYWREAGIPLTWQWLFEDLSGGHLVADVDRRKQNRKVRVLRTRGRDVGQMPVFNPRGKSWSEIYGIRSRNDPLRGS